MIESMIARSNNSDRFGIDASNLKLLLEGKIYPGYAILELNARLDIGAFVRIVSVVRAKLLDFVLELERNVPVSSAIMVGAQTPVSATDSAKVTHLTQNIFNAPVQNITTSGDASPVRANVIQGDTATLEAALADLGLSQRDANELAAIASHEAPTDKSSFGAKAAAWIGRRLSAGADGIMKIGGKVLEDDIAKLFRDFYNTF